MWGLYYPLDMVKSRCMAEVANAAIVTSNGGVAATSTIREVFRDVYRQGGIRAFYSGIQPAVRALYSTGKRCSLACSLRELS